MEPYSQCIVCCRPTTVNALCLDCKVPYQKAWCVGERAEILQQIVDDYKFKNVKAAHKPLAELLDVIVPHLPVNTVVVPVPTIPSHIRQRGYDHAWLMAKYFAKLRGHTVSKSILLRAANTTQRGSNRQERLRQASAAFSCPGEALDTSTPYLIIDDVITTGATLYHAAQTLKSAGASTIWVAAVSYHPGTDPLAPGLTQTYP